jgi:hypothetical protein
MRFRVCVEDLVEKQNKTTLFKRVSVPYRTPSACAKRATYPDPPPVILFPESIAAQAAYQEYCRNNPFIKRSIVGIIPILNILTSQAGLFNT